jgi:hypothetical protein
VIVPPGLKTFEGVISDVRRWFPYAEDGSESISEDIRVQPFRYFFAMVQMATAMEQYQAVGPSGQLPNCFPHKSSFVVQHFTLDTTGVLKLLLSPERRAHFAGKKIKDCKYQIWSSVFKINKAAFKCAFADFHFMLKTDGFSVSLIFALHKGREPATVEFPYVHDVPREEWDKLHRMRIVAFDPNKGNLIYAVDGDEPTSNVFRYTAGFRREGTGQRKREQQRQKVKTKEMDSDGLHNIL